MGENLRLIKAGSKHSPIEYKLYGDHLDFTQKTIKIQVEKWGASPVH
jgi:hypothetical protein